MEIQEFEIVDGLPVLFHPELDLLVVSDPHLGLEGTMTFDGNYVPRHQLDRLLEDLEKAKEDTGAERILVNGDLKNEFKTSRYSEKDEINDFLDFLDNNFEEIILVKGNHDTFLDSLVEDQGLEMKDYHFENGILFTHGHLDLEELDVEGFDTVVIGHEHPALALKDDIGVREKVSCFLYGDTEEGKNIIVLPAFSSISEGSNVNETPQDKFLSPVIRNNTRKNRLKAIAVSREAGIFEFPQLRKF